MLQKRAVSALTLAQRYAHLHRAPIQGRRLLAASVVATVVLVLLTALQSLLGALPPLLTILLVLLLVFVLPALLTRNHTDRRAEDTVYAELLAVIKDDTLSVPLVERVAVLAALPAATPPPLPALAQARLAQKLACASPDELATLPRAPLHAWLESLETPENLKIALLLTLGTAEDHAILPVAQALAQTAPTERLREAALECVKSLEQAR